MIIDDKLRPICSCGSKMKIFEILGYGEIIKYWGCNNCNIDIKIKDVDSDIQE